MTITLAEENRLKQLKPQEQANFRLLDATVDKIKKGRPGLNTNALTRYRDTWLDGVAAFHQKGDDRDFNIQWNENFRQNVKPEEKEAWNLFLNDLQPKSVLSGAIEQFYDKDKGGLQAGGWLGGALMGLLAYSQLGTSSWLSIIGIAIATVIGAWSGNGVADFAKNLSKGKERDDTPAPTVPEREREVSTTTPASEPTLSPEAAAAAKAEKERAALPTTNQGVKVDSTAAPGVTPPATTRNNPSPSVP